LVGRSPSANPRRIVGGSELGQKIGFIGRCEWLGGAWKIELISFQWAGVMTDELGYYDGRPAPSYLIRSSQYAGFRLVWAKAITTTSSGRFTVRALWGN
jgi:hypothetical protein